MERHMKRAIISVACVCALAAGGYYALSKWGIRHQALDLFDASRNRAIEVDLAVRRDYEMKANAGYWKLPVAIISHGNTVKNTEYSFLANAFATRGYLVASIQHDLPTDTPMVTREGSLYVGRLAAYERGEQNIFFAIDELKKIVPNADYDHLTLVGHSNGGDISMYFAEENPQLVKKVVTLDNLRVPLLTSGSTKILSFRSKDQNFKPDPGVVPSDEQKGIDIVKTDAQHTDMSDRGPDSLKQKIQTTLDHFLNEDDASQLSPADTKKPIVADPKAMGP